MLSAIRDVLILPEFLGALLLVGTAGVVLLALPIWIWFWRKKNPPVRRMAARIGGGMLGLYALFWIAGLIVAPTQDLTPGTEIRFCGLDCHLHVSVVNVQPGPLLGVTVRFRSNAVQAPEWPGLLHYRLRDASGKECAAIDRVPEEPLRAGDSVRRVLHFAAGGKPDTASLIVTWGNKLDLLVPGRGNPLVQRRQRLIIPALWGCA